MSDDIEARRAILTLQVVRRSSASRQMGAGEKRKIMGREKTRECPDCGMKEDPSMYSWDTYERACEDPSTCIRNLKERLDDVVSRLDSHRL
jgi:hypothetical protein